MRIGLAGWSLCRRFKSGELTLLDYPKTAVDEFGFSAIELNEPFFESRDEKYLAELAARITSAGCEVANIAVDREGNLASTDEAERLEAVRAHAEWFKIADVVNSRCIRANAGGSRKEEPSEETIQACIKSFVALAQIAAEHGRKILIENHVTKLGTNPDILVRIMQADSSGFLAMVPDFGNFAPEIRYEALEKVAPWTALVHAKMYNFAADGTETSMDVGRCVEVFKNAGFDGDILIECEAKNLDEHETIMKAKALLERYV